MGKCMHRLPEFDCYRCLGGVKPSGREKSPHYISVDLAANKPSVTMIALDKAKYDLLIEAVERTLRIIKVSELANGRPDLIEQLEAALKQAKGGV